MRPRVIGENVLLTSLGVAARAAPWEVAYASPRTGVLLWFLLF